MYTTDKKDPPKQKAVTVKEINGACIDTIPVGTEFLVTRNLAPDLPYSLCEGLCVNAVWNDEYKLI
jgi:hypothetical protein